MADAVAVRMEGFEGMPAYERLEVVKADASVVSVVFQRLCEGETLKGIAKGWGLPRGPFVEWYMTTHGDRYDAALRVLADEDARETVEIADGAESETVGPNKLQIDARKWRAARWDRQRYGDQVQHQVTGRAVLRVDFARPGVTVDPEGLVSDAEGS